MAENKIDQKMTLTQHLRDLKKCLIIAGAVFAIAFVVCYIFSSRFIVVVLGINPEYSFIQTDVTEMLAQQIKVALIAALVIDSPVIIWQIHSFVSPGLTRSEDGKFLAVMVGGLLLFALGAIFCYVIVIPFSLQFFKNLNSIEAVESLIDLQNYISYIVALLFAFGCIFEMPVIAAILSAVGILKPKIMASARQIVIVICFVVGALITPPDIMSQCMVALPMMLLYEVSIGICRVIYNAKRKRLIANGIDPDEDEEEEEEKKKKKAGRWASAKAQVEMADARKAKEKKQK